MEVGDDKLLWLVIVVAAISMELKKCGCVVGCI